MKQDKHPVFEHVVVLMLENRSYDNMLAYMEHEKIPTINHLTGDAKLLHDARYCTRFDPGHHVQDFAWQTSDAKNLHANYFANYQSHIRDCDAPMEFERYEATSVFTKPLPVISTLAKEFATCTNYFCLGGPTYPNRFMFHCADNGGMMDNTGQCHSKTVFEHLEQHGKSWKLYLHDISESLYCSNLWQVGNSTRLATMAQFEKDVQQDKLPNYAFLEPRYYGPLANDQHPPNDVLLGEQLILDVYSCLYQNPNLFAKTLLIITYDEHGGFYDHVHSSYGVRVPTLLIAPQIAPQTVVDQELNHASMMSTLFDIFKLETAPTINAPSMLRCLQKSSRSTLPCPTAMQHALFARRLEPKYQQDMERMRWYHCQYHDHNLRYFEFYLVKLWICLFGRYLHDSQLQEQVPIAEYVTREMDMHMQEYEQRHQHDWDGVVAQVASELRDMQNLPPLCNAQVRQSMMHVQPVVDKFLQAMKK